MCMELLCRASVKGVQAQVCGQVAARGLNADLLCLIFRKVFPDCQTQALTLFCIVIFWGCNAWLPERTESEDQILLQCWSLQPSLFPEVSCGMSYLAMLASRADAQAGIALRQKATMPCARKLADL